jgi:pimeloyl-ACP methyl ester carboxylesterase
MKVMERAAVDGLELEYELRGSGEPVVLIHWGVSATWAEPLLEEAVLVDRYRLLSYHRAGFGGSSLIEVPVTMSDQELPALWQRWSFTEEDAGRITQPVLVVVGEKSAPTFPERRELLRSWLPKVELFELPGATHLLHVENPRGMAEGLASFFGRHPIPASI